MRHFYVVKSLIIPCLSQPCTRTIYLWSQADFHNIRKRISSLCEEFTASYTISSRVLWDTFITICNACQGLVPTKQSSSNPKQPWITSLIKRLSRRKQKAYNHARKTNDPQHWTKYYSLKRNANENAVLHTPNLHQIWLALVKTQ